MFMLYKSLYYRYYAWAKKLGMDNTPEYTALFTMTMIVVVNLVSGYVLFLELTGSKGFSFLNSTLKFFAFWMLIWFLNDFLLLRRGKLPILLSLFERENEKEKNRGNWLAALVAGGTVTLFFVLLAYR